MTLHIATCARSLFRGLLSVAISVLVVLPASAAKQEYLLVDNYFGGNILRYDLVTGAFVDELVPKGRGGLALPTGMTIGPDGYLYVAADTRAGPGGEVLKFNAKNGKYMGTVVSGLTESGLDGLAFGTDGNLYVADFLNKVHRFDGTSGVYMGVFASIDAPGNQFRDIAWGPDGDLYAAQVVTGTVARFDGQTGTLVGILGSAETSAALDIAFGPDGMLYVSEYWSGGKSLDIYNPTTGAYVKSLESPYLNGPNGMVFDDKGKLYANSLWSNTIVRFSGDHGTLFAEGPPLAGPQDLVITNAVPEPGTIALMFGGLAIMGVIALRRRDRRSSELSQSPVGTDACAEASWGSTYPQF